MWTEAHEWATLPNPQEIIAPKSAIKNTYTPQTYGPAVFATNQNLAEVLWQLLYDRDTTEVIARNSNGNEFLLFYTNDVAFRFDITFSADGRPFVAYETKQGCWIYWYDPVVFNYVLTYLGDENRNPFCSLDIYSVENNHRADVVVTYTRGNTQYYRISDDRYQTEYTVPDLDLSSGSLIKAGIGDKLRFTLIHPVIAE